MAVQRAQIQEHRAALCETFGRELLIKKFGEAGAAIVLDAFGVFKSGKNKGQPRGFIHWRKCTVGGWTRDNGGLGHVCRPGSFDFAVCLSFDRTRAIGARAEIIASDASDAEYLETLIRGLARITDRWCDGRNRPVKDFPQWAEVHATHEAEKAARLAATLAEHFPHLIEERS